MSELKQLYNKYFRVVLFIVFLVVVVYLIIRNIGAFGNVLLVMLGFGAVVLVHEFGHFIVAKLSNIKVEAFSIFMPPILLGVRRTEKGYRFRILPEIFPKEGDESGEGAMNFTIGRKGQVSETEYRVGLIPFGGFVKMLGQDDIGSVKTSDDPRSYANKPVHIRAATIAAGVVFNVVSAVIIFMITFLIGIKLPPPVVGGVVPDSPAARAGLKAGDEIIEIAGKKNDLDFPSIAIAAALSGRDEEIPLKVRHPDGTEEQISLVAEVLEDEPMRRFGILSAASLTVAKLPDEDANDLFAKTGLLPGDRIISVNGMNVRGHWELVDIIQSTLLPEVTLSAERTRDDGKSIIVESRVRLYLNVASNPYVQSESDLSHIYSMVPRLMIILSADEQNSSKEGTDSYLQAGDIILAAGDINNPTYKELRDVIEEHEDKELPIKVLRVDPNGIEEPVLITVIPQRPEGGERPLIGVNLALDAEHPVVAETIKTEQGPSELKIPSGASITAVDGEVVSNFYDVIREIKKYPGERITIDWRLDQETAGNVIVDVGMGDEFISVKSLPAENIPFADLKRSYKASGPINAIVMGYRRTVMFIAQTYVTLKRLAGGLVSPKNLIGPVGIITFSYRIVSEQPIVYYVYFLGLISAVIAVFNFLPLPPLDGGLVVLLLVEKIKGSALSERVQTIIAYTGWMLILALFLYVTFNDIIRSFFSPGFGS
jgi:regulator of sigma E protease